ncbi:MAG: T9SS type A sorting domain-containing protein, partial [Salibacter sp.]|uniref:T9SS type A sorting domain-containing protein n=1 Tax=Salibacter sp. TaxID=2010995 RepID=UPI00287054F7
IIDTTEVPDSLVNNRIYYWTSNSEQIIFQSLFNHLYSFKPGAIPEISISRKTDKGIYRFALDDQNRIWFTDDFIINRLSLADTALDVEQVSGFKMSHNPGNTDFIKTFGDEVLAVFDGGYITATTDVEFHEMDYLTLNDFNIPVYPEGSFGTSYYLPDDFRKITYKNNSILYSDKLWVSGKSKSTGIDYFSGSRVIGYNYNNDHYFIGFNPGPNQTDLNHYRNYRTFKVTRAQIDDHIANYNSSSYEAPEDIREWPAHGNPNAGESTCIAPFIDVNNDEIYDPNDGDYPQIRGDEAVYTVFNDLRHSPMRPIDPVGVEGHLMIYGYDSPDPVLSKTFFVNYRLINIGSNRYKNLLTGINNRSGIGAFTDDFIGCDTLNNFYYYYNNDDFDDTALDQLGFGSNPPSLGIIPLNKNLNSFVSWDGVSGSQTEIPYNKEFSVNFLKGWKNYGAAFYANSYRTVNPNQAYGDTTKFIFTGDPVQDTGWTHYRDSTFTFINNSYPVSNGTVGGLNHGDFNPGDTVEIDYAITIAENTGNTLYSEVADLRTQVQDIQNWYNNYQFDDWKHSCMLVNSTIPKSSITDKSDFKIYPNPTLGAFTLQVNSLKRGASFQLFNSLGTLIKDGAIQAERTNFNFSSLSSGVYLLKVNNGDRTSTQPLIIE